jgi:hypothetical protein
MTRPVYSLLAVALAVAATPALARHKPTAAADSNPDAADKTGQAGKPVQVGTFSDWGAYLAKGKNKTCYALAMPKERKPEGKKESAYVFIADRPAEKVHNEVSIMMGFPIKETGTAQAKVGAVGFDLVAKGSNAWIKNPADESKFVDALKHAPKLVVRASSTKGATTVDTYSLAGLKQALDRADKDCR